MRSVWPLLLLLPNLCWADAPPTRWQRARDPERKERFELHRSVRDRLAGEVEEAQPFFDGRGFGYESARIALEDAKVLTLGDPTLLFDYGEVLEALDEHEAAIDALSRALELAPDHQAAAEAHLTLAFAYAKTDRSEEELDHYRQYLRLTRHRRGTATATLNMAEAQMRLGRLREAIRGYREAYQLAQSSPSGSYETAALACYGLAVALDRQGDLALSAHELGSALSIDPSMYLVTASPNVFFVPSYERSYYIGLGFEARARDTSQPLALRHSHARRALAAFQSYVNSARDGDRWLLRAREHVRELQVMQKALPAPPPTVAPGLGF